MDTATNANPAQESKTIFLLTFREDTSVGEPLCFFSRDIAYETMKRQYENTLSCHNAESYDASESYCYFDTAVIALYGGWLQWNIWEVHIDAQTVDKEASQ